MSLRDRYCSSRRRRPTSSSSPRRLWWSCLCTLRCSVRSLIRRVSSATWTSGEPVSPSLVACPAMISFLTAVSSGTCVPYLVSVIPGSTSAHFRAHAGTGGLTATRDAPSRPLEGAADTADDVGHHVRYHGSGLLMASRIFPYLYNTRQRSCYSSNYYPGQRGWVRRRAASAPGRRRGAS